MKGLTALALAGLALAVLIGTGRAFPTRVEVYMLGGVERARVGSAIDSDTTGDWAAFEMADLIERREQSGRAYLRFLDVPTLNAGIYHLATGAVDRQQPHRLDEVYYVVSGRAVLEVDGEKTPVKPGSIVYVKAQVPHRFHSIEEDLTVLVFFSAAGRGS